MRQERGVRVKMGSVVKMEKEKLTRNEEACANAIWRLLGPVRTQAGEGVEYISTSAGKRGSEGLFRSLRTLFRVLAAMEAAEGRTTIYGGSEDQGPPDSGD